MDELHLLWRGQASGGSEEAVGASECLPHLLLVPSRSCECFKAPLCSPLTEVSSEQQRCRRGSVRAGECHTYGEHSVGGP